MEEILSEAETEDAVQDLNSRNRQDLKRIKQVDVLNALTVEAVEVGVSTKGPQGPGPRSRALGPAPGPRAPSESLAML